METQGTVTISIEEYDELRKIRNAASEKYVVINKYIDDRFGDYCYSYSNYYYFNDEGVKELINQLNEQRSQAESIATKYESTFNSVCAALKSKRAWLKLRKIYLVKLIDYIK